MKLLPLAEVIGEIDMTEASKIKSILTDIYGYYSTVIKPENLPIMLDKESAKRAASLLSDGLFKRGATYEALAFYGDFDVEPVKYNKVFGWML